MDNKPLIIIALAGVGYVIWRANKTIENTGKTIDNIGAAIGKTVYNTVSDIQTAYNDFSLSDFLQSDLPGTTIVQKIPDNAPRGIRNKNPGNIQYNGDRWRGMVGIDPDGFVKFDIMNNGLRALGIDLLNKQLRGLNTIHDIISVYAPNTENDTEAYIETVSNIVNGGYNPNAVLDIEPDITAQLMMAIIAIENGPVWTDYINDDEILGAAYTAFSDRSVGDFEK